MIESIGWIATAGFAGSYFLRHPVALRAVQVCAALLWVAYGLAIGAVPVVVANVLVATAACWTAVRPLAPRPDAAEV